jgi:hypothetical protein
MLYCWMDMHSYHQTPCHSSVLTKTVRFLDRLNLLIDFPRDLPIIRNLSPKRRQFIHPISECLEYFKRRQLEHVFLESWFMFNSRRHSTRKMHDGRLWIYREWCIKNERIGQIFSSISMKSIVVSQTLLQVIDLQYHLFTRVGTAVPLVIFVIYQNWLKEYIILNQMCDPYFQIGIYRQFYGNWLSSWTHELVWYKVAYMENSFSSSIVYSIKSEWNSGSLRCGATLPYWN